VGEAAGGAGSGTTVGASAADGAAGPRGGASTASAAGRAFLNAHVGRGAGSARGVGNGVDSGEGDSADRPPTSNTRLQCRQQTCCPSSSRRTLSTVRHRGHWAGMCKSDMNFPTPIA